MLILSEKEIAQAASLLKAGKVIAFPTETVYGLGASIFQPDAIADIFRVKGRPQDNPLIAHISHLDQVHQIAQEIPDLFYALADIFFPGPLTIVLRKKAHVPSIVSAGLNSIALRMPSHPIAQQLIEWVGEPIVAPSANISGKPSATCCQHVIDDFEGKIAAVIEGGKTYYGIESTVISLIDDIPVLLRPGAVSSVMIEQVIKRPVLYPSSNLESAPPPSPGMKYRHYAPKAPVSLFKDLAQLLQGVGKDPNVPKMILSREPPSCSLPASYHWFPLNASDFYARLRQADDAHYCEILICCDEQTLLDLALMNRILKASSCI